MLSMVDELRWNVEQQDKELYKVARDAAKVAEREGRAQVQAAVEAARVLAQAEQEPQQEHHRCPSSLRVWTLKFRDARLEAAYNRKAKTNCDNHDHVAALCRLWACAPALLMALSGHRLSWGWPLASASRAGLYLCVLCNLCIAVVCAMVLIVQLRFPDWYRSHRGTTVLWFASALWVVESAQLFVTADDLRVYITQILVPALYMGFTSRLPYIVHLKSRAFGLGCQAVAILGSTNFRHAPLLLLTSLLGHSLGALLVYFLDRRSRQDFLSSLPRWLLDNIRGSRSQPLLFQSYRASLSRQMWQIFYPELFEPSKDPVRGTLGTGRSEEPVRRRALGGFAGGFGGVSSLKCKSPLSSTLVSLSSSSPSTTESESSSGEYHAGVQPLGTGCVKVPGVPRAMSQGRRSGGSVASASSSATFLDTMETSHVRYRGKKLY